MGSLYYQRIEGRRYLSERGYPPELYDYQHRLKKLDMEDELDLERFTWLSSDSIEGLSLKAAPSSNSIAGLATLAHCRSLKKLTLYLSRSQVSELQPLEQLKGLTQLTLHLGNSQVRDVKPLEQLKGLTQLTLDLNDKVGNLEWLTTLPNLRKLSISNATKAQRMSLQKLPPSVVEQLLGRIALALSRMQLYQSSARQPCHRPIFRTNAASSSSCRDGCRSPWFSNHGKAAHPFPRRVAPPEASASRRIVSPVGGGGRSALRGFVMESDGRAVKRHYATRALVWQPPVVCQPRRPAAFVTRRSGGGGRGRDLGAHRVPRARGSGHIEASGTPFGTIPLDAASTRDAMRTQVARLAVLTCQPGSPGFPGGRLGQPLHGW
jgi:hypothetical protein